jgi:hypothetical protein
VPPPQLDVNVAIVSLAAPEIAWFNAYDTYAEAEFTKYVKPETAAALALRAPGGGEVAYTLEYPTHEASLDGTVYAKRFRLEYAEGFAAASGTYALESGPAVKSYAGVSAKQETLTAELELPLALSAPAAAEAGYGKTAAIDVRVENYNPAKPLAITAESDFGFIAEVADVSAIGADGSATVSVAGNLPGNANIIIRIAEKGLEAVVPVSVTMPDGLAMITISPVEANVPAGGEQQFSATDEATGLAANVAWSLSGNSSAGTAISAGGLLTVGADETAETLAIRAAEAGAGGRSATATAHVAPATGFLLGDVNGDELVNMQDVLLAYQYFRGKAALDGAQLLAADVNGDSAVTMQDVLTLYQYFRGNIASL